MIHWARLYSNSVKAKIYRSQLPLIPYIFLQFILNIALGNIWQKPIEFLFAL
jgi:hypothetical protein